MTEQETEDQLSESSQAESSAPPLNSDEETASAQLQGQTEEPSRNTLVVKLVHMGINLLAVALVMLLAFLVWQRVTTGKAEATQPVELVAGQPAEEVVLPKEVQQVALLPISTPSDTVAQGIPRLASLLTIIPTRPRADVITYTVQLGDTLFDIAEKYGLKPETLLWGNYETLKDDPHLLSPDQVLNILPVDGTYYQWKEGDTLDGVASFFGVDQQAILDYPGNHFDLTEIANGGAGIQPGTWVIVPGGKREIKDWGPPAISRSNPASASYYGPGSCGKVYEGAIGTGAFVWPTTEHFISGYNYSGIHRAIDIGGALGNAVFAADSGVVVYAGWSNFGYGNLIAIDHGNGWQTAYAHLSAIGVTCGQSVYRGGYIGAVGSTGNSSGPHLHFEMIFNGTKPNPLDYLP